MAPEFDDFTPGRSVQADEASTPWVIEQLYLQGDRKKQWLAELFRNCRQAGATNVQFGIWWEGLKPETLEDLPIELEPSYRFVLYDNGCGMEDPGAYMQKIMRPTVGPDGETRFGSGSRVALLPWNRRGLVVATWVEGDVDGKLIWIAYNDSTNSYSFVSHVLVDDDDNETRSDIVNASEYPELLEGKPDWLGLQEDGSVKTGTMFLLMGNSPSDNTFRGPDGDFGATEMAKYLMQRFWELPQGLDARFEYPSGEMSGWQDLARDRYNRESFSGVVPKNADSRSYNFPVNARNRARSVFGDGITQGKLDAPDGSVINWWLTPEANTYTGRDVANKPFIGVLFEKELYHISMARHAPFGVGTKDMKNRLTILIEPPHYSPEAAGVISTTSRDALLWRDPTDDSGGGELPWADWGDHFAENLPDEIGKALMETTTRADVSVDDALGKKLADDIKGYMTQPIWTEVPSNVPSGGGNNGQDNGEGTSEGDPVKDKNKNKGTGNERGKPKKKRRRKRVKNSDEGGQGSKTKKVAQPGALPDVRMDWNRDMDYEENALVMQNGDVFHIDGGHVAIVSLLNFWDERTKGGGVEVLRDPVGTVLVANLSGRIAHLRQWNRDQLKIDDNAFSRDYLSPTSLSVSLFGLVAEYPGITNRIRGVLTKK